ncbi:MAG TPA: hypothetical protein VN628_12100 [Vicinamibacterales bacterium]|nr:hypothetical protein [Vicinamibacterales bacterium]
MKKIFVAAALLAMATLKGSPYTAVAFAQEPTPRTADGHPDLSGVWWPGQDLRVPPLNPAPAAGRAGGPPPAGRGAPPRREKFADNYNDAAKAKARTLSDKDDPTLRCQNTAFGTLNVSAYNTGLVAQIIQTPKFVVILSETNPTFRIIPTDGRTRRDEQPPSSRGESLGRWDGDVLVVDTANFSDKNWMHAEGDVSFHSDALHIVERYHRINKDTMEVDATIEDPKVLAKPWKVPTQTLKLAPFDQILALDCTGVESATLMEAASKQNYGKKQQP